MFNSEVEIVDTLGRIVTVLESLLERIENIDRTLYDQTHD